MRIRSIKPEFWRSDDIDALCIEDRLLFVGLWSYVDDAGVGVDKESSIAADLFAGDLGRDFMETSLRVHGGLKRLHAAGLIQRYEADGRRFLHIVCFAKHQKINRPTPSKYPPPTSGNALPPDPDTGPHGGLSEGSLRARKGAGEQGSRGTGEQGSKNDAPLRSASSAQLAVIDGGPVAPSEPPVTAQAAVQAWHDAYTATHDAKPTRQQLGQVGREANQLLKAGNPPERVVAACRSAGSRGFATVQREYADLASRSARPRSAPPRASTTDARVQAGLELASKYDRMEAG